MKPEEILRNFRVIAVVGCSRNAEKPSHYVSAYLKEHGYRIIPVNPNAEEILGEKCYASLLSIPEKIDVVEIFRPSEDAGEIVDDAIKKEAKVVWMQSGIINEKAADKAKKAGMIVIMDRCMMIEHKKMKQR